MDREKVIKQLENDAIATDTGYVEVPLWLFSEIIAVLKEQEAVVRCKDCKHRPIKPNDYETGFDLEFPDGKCPCQCDDGWYSWYPHDNWYCADGERRSEDA